MLYRRPAWPQGLRTRSSTRYASTGVLMSTGLGFCNRLVRVTNIRISLASSGVQNHCLWLFQNCFWTAWSCGPWTITHLCKRKGEVAGSSCTPFLQLLGSFIRDNLELSVEVSPKKSSNWELSVFRKNLCRQSVYIWDLSSTPVTRSDEQPHREHTGIQFW